MASEKEIQELKEAIDQLSADMHLQQDKLAQLRARLLQLETGKPVTTNKADVISAATVDTPPKPALSEKLSLENFIGLRLMHTVGIVVLVVGISIGVKYAVDQQLISETARIALAYLAGAILYFLSARLKKKFELFSAILFSGAMASLYFTTYAAFVYYQLFPFELAFALMLAITLFTAYTALRYNRQEIAILGMTGAYGIPFLISANADNVHLFFSYILLINSGIFFLSFKKNWKSMILLAMLISWTLYIGWAMSRYDNAKDQELVAFGFLAAFYLLFAVASLAFSVWKKQALQILEVQHFIINNVLAVMAALLVYTNNDFDDRSAVVMGVACILFAAETIILRLMLSQEILLFKYLAAMTVISLAAFIGIQWDGLAVTISWIGIAIVLFAAGAWTKMAWLRLLSILLTGVTLVKLITIDRKIFSTGEKIIAFVLIGILLLVLSFFYQKYRQRFLAGK